MASPTDSQVLRMTLPTKPSQTTTSTGMSKKIVAFDVAAEVERAALQHLEDFFRQVGAFHILAANRHQTDRGILVAEHVARIDRAHDRRIGADVRARASLFAPASIRTKIFVSEGKMAAMPGPIDSRQGAQFDRRRGDGGAGVARADNRGRFALFHKINRAADGRVFLAPDGIDGAIGHLDNLGRMHDLDPAIVAFVLLQLGFDLRGVADEKEFVDLRIFAQCQDRAADEIWWPEIAAHGVQSDFHRGANLRFSVLECKTKNLKVESGRLANAGHGEYAESRPKIPMGHEAPSNSAALDRQHLSALVISAGRAGGVRRDRAAALRAFVELRRLPAMRRLARAQPHLRSFAFWDSHKSEIRKAGNREKATGFEVASDSGVLMH